MATARSTGSDRATTTWTPGERLNERITRSWTRLTSAWRAFDEARQNLPPGDRGRGSDPRSVAPDHCSTSSATAASVQQPAIEIEDKQYPDLQSMAQHARFTSSAARVSLDRRTAGVRGAAATEPAQPRPRAAQPLPRPAVGDRLQRPDAARAARQRRRSPARRTCSSTSKRCSAVRSMPTSCCCGSFATSPGSRPTSPRSAGSSAGARRAAKHGHPRARRAPPGRGGRDRSARRRLPRPPSQQTPPRAARRRASSTRWTTTAPCCGSSTGCSSCSSPRTATLLLDPTADKLPTTATPRYYSTAHLRRLASKRRGGRHHDRYEQLKLVMDGAARRRPCQPLAFHRSVATSGSAPRRPARRCEARERGPVRRSPRRSRHVEHDGVRRAVDFRNLGAEELGSVYESLLELHPELNRDTRDFKLDAVTGTERKTTGSYYTPTSPDLVACSTPRSSRYSTKRRAKTRRRRSSTSRLSTPHAAQATS